MLFRNEGNPMNKTTKIIFITFATLLLCGISLRGKITHEKFDSAKWKNSDLNLEENWSLRWDMMNSLRNDYNLVGKTKNEIINLLGDSREKSKTEMVYGLGYTGNGINAGVLTISFNQKGIVTEVSVREG
jgi:hypothetical protein